MSDVSLIRDYLIEGVKRGYIYNPRFRGLRHLQLNIVFRRSEDEPLIQLADMLAYAARSLKAGTIDRQEAEVYRRRLRVANPGRIIWLEYI